MQKLLTSLLTPLLAAAAVAGFASTASAQSRIKDIARSAGVRVSGDFVDAANAAAVGLINAAIGRAKGNGRQTIRPQDI